MFTPMGRHQTMVLLLLTRSFLFLIEAKLISKVKGIIPKVKILNGVNDFNVKLTFSKVEFSALAKEKVVKAGGSIAE